MSAPPVISVVLACKNPGPRLPAALASLWAQAGPAPEVIVIDGASTDGTREWLQSQQDRLAAVVSEPDTGVYAALNHGRRLAHGDWLLFLGADDRLATGTVLAQVAPHLDPSMAIVFVGEASYDDGRIYRLADPPRPAARNFVHHQAAFYHCRCFTPGGYDETLRFQADYDLNLRLWRAGARFVSLPLRVAECASGGLSDAGHWANYREEITVRHRHCPASHCWFWDLLSVVRFGRKQYRHHFIRHG